MNLNNSNDSKTQCGNVEIMLTPEGDEMGPGSGHHDTTSY